MAPSSTSPAKFGSNSFGMLVLFGVGIVVLGVLSPHLLASSSSTGAELDSSNLSWVLARIVLFVILAAVACISLARMTNRRPNAIGNMKVLASLPIEQIMLHLVQAGDKRLLIGVDAVGVKALAELPSMLPVPESFPVPVPTSATVSGHPLSQVIGPLPASAGPAFASELAALLEQRKRS